MASHNLIPCPGCGKRSVSSAKHCAHCGTALNGSRPVQPHPPRTSVAPPIVAAPPLARQPAPPAQDPAPAGWGGNFHCPVCQSPNITRLPAVASKGSWGTAGVGVSHYSNGNGQYGTMYTQTVSSGATQLAQILGQPAPPRKRFDHAIIGIGALLLGFVTAACILTSVTYFDNASKAKLNGATNASELVAGGFACLVAALVFGVPMVFAARQYTVKDAEANAEVDSLIPFYHRRLDIWNRCFYCERCHCVHDPATRAARPAERAGEIINA